MFVWLVGLIINRLAKLYFHAHARHALYPVWLQLSVGGAALASLATSAAACCVPLGAACRVPLSTACRLPLSAACLQERLHHSQHFVHALPNEAVACAGELRQPRACRQSGGGSTRDAARSNRVEVTQMNGGMHWGSWTL